MRTLLCLILFATVVSTANAQVSDSLSTRLDERLARAHDAVLDGSVWSFAFSATEDDDDATRVSGRALTAVDPVAGKLSFLLTFRDGAIGGHPAEVAALSHDAFAFKLESSPDVFADSSRSSFSGAPFDRLAFFPSFGAALRRFTADATGAAAVGETEAAGEPCYADLYAVEQDARTLRLLVCYSMETDLVASVRFDDGDGYVVQAVLVDAERAQAPASAFSLSPGEGGAVVPIRTPE